jgi:uncharacterized membrane protein YdjX (TVP38/TMEM64 family)
MKNIPIPFTKTIILVLITLVFFWFYSSEYAHVFTFDNLVNSKSSLLEITRQNYTLSIFIFVIVYIVSTSLALPIASVLTLAGGLLFGYFGILLVLFAATTGATFNFLLSRFVIGDYIQDRYSTQLKSLNKELARHGNNYLLFLHLMPIFPFFLVNLLSGITKIKLKNFIWTTLIGILPGIIAYIYAGKQFTSITSIEDIMTPKIILALCLLAILTIFPIAINRPAIHNKKI